VTGLNSGGGDMEVACRSSRCCETLSSSDTECLASPTEYSSELCVAKDCRGSLVKECRCECDGEDKDMERCDAVSASSSSDSLMILGCGPDGDGGGSIVETIAVVVLVRSNSCTRRTW